MNALSLVTECPEWCESKEKMGDCEDGHDGPAWTSLPIDGGFDSLEVFAGSNKRGRIVVHVSTGNGVNLTPEEALQVGRNLIEAAQWCAGHKVA